jgi:hypothetical protein
MLGTSGTTDIDIEQQRAPFPIQLTDNEVIVSW